jgi:hypothetical protein
MQPHPYGLDGTQYHASTQWHSSEGGWWLRMMMASLIAVVCVLGINACREGSIDKRLRDQEAREARAVRKRDQ